MESDGEEDFTLKINEEFAKKYERKKEAEELSKLKEKYPDEEYTPDRLQKIAERKRKYGIKDDEPVDGTIFDDVDSDESSSEEEDETGELVTPAVDAQIMRTISLIRAKDPRLYKSDEVFFSEEALEKAKKEWEEKQKVKKAEKRVTLKDYHRKVLLEDGGFVDEEKELTHVEEQNILKEDVKRAFATVKGGDEDGEDFFTMKQKTLEDIEKEEEDYKNFLLESIADDKAGAQAFRDWQNSRDNPNVDPEEAFLIEYILNRGWIDKNSNKNPSYGEIIGDIDVDEDEEALDAADNFESKYNFRFEEEGANHLVTHGRYVEGSVRRQDDKRKRQRVVMMERKKQEAQQKAEELKRLKNLKKKEIFEKLKHIQEITGNKDIGVDEVDLDGDFDPEAYDAKMSKAFNDEYYEEADSEKPTWEEDINIDDILAEMNEEENNNDKVKGEKKKGKKKGTAKEHKTSEINEYTDGNQGNSYKNEDDFIMDADYLPGGEKYEEAKPKKSAKTNVQLPIPESKKSRKQNFNDYLDEYYQLDYEDMIGDLPTRFKYAKVNSENFGLTPVEILLADDKDLNDVISLKKLAPYRPVDKRERDMSSWKKSKKKRLHEFRLNLAKSVSENKLDEKLKDAKGWELPFIKKRKVKEAEKKALAQATGGKKKKQKSLDVDVTVKENNSTDENMEEGNMEEKKKKKKKKKLEVG